MSNETTVSQDTCASLGWLFS